MGEKKRDTKVERRSQLQKTARISLGSSVKRFDLCFCDIKFYSTCVNGENALEAKPPKLKAEDRHWE